MSTGTRIKSLRTQRGFTQDDMAEKLNMNRANFSNYERDVASPPGETLAKIADILLTNTDYLLGRTDDASSTPNHKIPDWATSKDKRDFKKMLEEDGEIMFDGVPMTVEARQRVMDVLTGLFWEAKQMNKRKKKPTTDDTSESNNS